LEDRLLEFAARIGKLVEVLPDKKDFIHKLGTALKELRESRVWIKLILKSDILPADRIEPLLDESNIIGKSVVTAKENLPQKSKP